MTTLPSKFSDDELLSEGIAWDTRHQVNALTIAFNILRSHLDVIVSLVHDEQACQCVYAKRIYSPGMEEQPVDEEPLNDQQARQQIAKTLSNIDYSTGSREFWSMAISASPRVINTIQQVNAAKQHFKLIHSRVRKLAKSPGEASEHLRDILKKIDQPSLDLDRCDCKLPHISKPITQLQWFWVSTPPSERKTVREAIAALEEYAKNATDQRAWHLHQDIARLQSLHGDTPVALRNKVCVHSLRFRYRHVDTQKPQTGRGYATNPVFFPQDSIGVVRFKDISRQREPGGGRRSSISNEPVSPNLNGWYWYFDRPSDNLLKAPPKKKAAPAKLDTQVRNPFAKTAVEGVWFALQTSKKGVSVTISASVNSRRKKASVTRYGLTVAWVVIMEQHAKHHNEPLERLLRLMPSEDQLAKAIAWHRANRKPSICVGG